MKTQISPSQLANLPKQEPVQVIDVRSPSEYATAHLPGALNVPVEEVESRIDDLPTDRQIVLVCQSGNRATMACDLIQHTGRNLSVLTGGTAAWMDAGMPIVRPTRTRWSLERQLRLTVGALVLAGAVLSATASTARLALPLLVSLGPVYAGLTDQCPMAMLFAVMPWNRARPATATCEGVAT